MTLENKALFREEVNFRTFLIPENRVSRMRLLSKHLMYQSTWLTPYNSTCHIQTRDTKLNLFSNHPITFLVYKLILKSRRHCLTLSIILHQNYSCSESNSIKNNHDIVWINHVLQRTVNNIFLIETTAKHRINQLHTFRNSGVYWHDKESILLLTKAKRPFLNSTRKTFLVWRVLLA